MSELRNNERLRDARCEMRDRVLQHFGMSVSSHSYELRLPRDNPILSTTGYQLYAQDVQLARHDATSIVEPRPDGDSSLIVEPSTKLDV
jgi:hypothetical protein